MRRKLKKNRKRIFRKKAAGVILLALLVICVTVFIKDVVIVRHEEKKRQEKFAASQQISVYFKEEDVVRTMQLEDYLTGVVLGEMPAEFNIEALKAQAVAARTFIVRRATENREKNQNDAHKGADICTDPAHCQAYRNPDTLSQKFKKQYWEKIRSAVGGTRGEILVYQDAPINAVFFAMSGGKTENSKDVWSGDLPYLKSVDSAMDENAPDFETKVTVSLEEFKRQIKDFDSSADFKKNLPVGSIQHSEGGSVSTVTMGGVLLKGTQVRGIFNLRSANFTAQVKEKEVEFTVKGYGHGVGMSQWGANFLGKEGKKYDEILKTYYQDVEIKKIYE